MHTHTMKVSSKGWVVIPKELRDKYGITEGAQVQVVEYGGVLALMPVPDDPIAALHGMLAAGPSLTDDLLSERAEERAREESPHE